MEPMTARLFTARGEPVADVEIPPFETGYPPVIAWGSRCFTRIGDPTLDQYVEVFCYTATVQVMQRDRHDQIGGTNGSRG